MSHVDDLTYRLNMGFITEREFDRQYDDAQYEDYMDRLDYEAQMERAYQEDMEKQYEEYCQEEYKKYVKSLAATKGGHTHNHQRNALKRMRRCRGCDKPITKYEGFKSHFSGHICMECHVEDCLEHASMVGISIQWPLFEELYNPYIRRK